MTRNIIQVENLSSDELRDLIKDELEKVFDKNSAALKHPGDEFLSAGETASLLKVTKTTLHNWRKQGILIPIKFGNRILYRLSDLQKKMEE